MSLAAGAGTAAAVAADEGDLLARGPSASSSSSSSSSSSPSSSSSASPPAARRAGRQHSASAAAIHLAAGSVAGAAQTAFWHPLDVLKTRLQVQDARVGPTPSYSSLRDAVVSMARKEGARGFFQGVCPNIVGSAVGWGLQMPLYNALKAFASESSHEYESGRPQLRRDLLCSLVSGGCVTVFVHPIFLVKTRLQLQAATRSSLAPGSGSYRGPAHAVARILRDEGPRGLYRGFGPSLALCSHGAALLVAYDQLKVVCPSTLAASFAAKVFASLATYPVQVIRAVMQQRPLAGQPSPPQGIGRTVAALWRSGGPFAFYRGLSAQMMRTVPQAMAFFSVYEIILERLTCL